MVKRGDFRFGGPIRGHHIQQDRDSYWYQEGGYRGYRGYGGYGGNMFGFGNLFGGGRHHRHDLEYGLGVGAGVGLFGMLGNLFGGGHRRSHYAGYDDGPRSYVPEQAPPSGEEVGTDGRLRLGQSRTEADIPDEARRAARGARQAGVIPEPYHSGDYRDLTPDQRGRFQQHKRAADRSRENDWTKDVFNRGG